MKKSIKDEIINSVFDIEDKINIQKSWIEITNTIYENEYNGIKLGLLLAIVEEQNTDIYNNLEKLLTLFGHLR